MALTRAQIQTAFQNSLGRAASQTDEDSYFAVSQSGALPDATIFSSISNSREADLISDPAVRFYQAAFGRVPDQAGLDNTQDYIRANGASAATYQMLSDMFAQSPEFTNRFGTGETVTAAYVQALYSTILGRQASAGEVDAFVSGANGYDTRGEVLYAISQSDEAISLSTTAVNGFLQNAAEGDATYTGSLFTVDNGSPAAPGETVGQVFTLTNGNNVNTGGIDTLTGTAGADTFRAVSADSLEDGDTLNGGGGTDTLFIDDGAIAGGDASPVISNIEFIDNEDTGNLDLENVIGVTRIDSSQTGVTYENASLATVFGSDTYNADDDNVAATQTIGIDYDSDNLGAGSTANLAVVTGEADLDVTFNLTVDGAASTADDIDSIALAVNEDANEDTDGTEVNTITIAADEIETITVTGDGDAAIVSDSVDLTSFNASAATGDIDFTSAALEDDYTASGGSGANVFDFTDATGDGLITGGAGGDDLTGGEGDDIFGGGAGLDTIRLAAGGNDEVHLNGFGGLDTVTGFTILAGGDDTDVVSFLDNGVISFANSTDSGNRGASDLDEDDYEEFATIGEVEAETTISLDQKVVNVTGASDRQDIQLLETQDAAEFYGVFEVGANTEIWYDADWSNIGGRTQIAELTGVVGITLDNLDVYV